MAEAMRHLPASFGFLYRLVGIRLNASRSRSAFAQEGRVSDVMDRSTSRPSLVRFSR